MLNAVRNYTTLFLLLRIDGPHNKAVLATVQAEMHEKSEDCSLSTIRSMIVCDCVYTISKDIKSICLIYFRCSGYLQKKPLPETKRLFCHYQKTIDEISTTTGELI